MSAGPSNLNKPVPSRKRRAENGAAGPRKRSKAKDAQLKRIGDEVCGYDMQTRRCQNQVPKRDGLRYCFVCSARHGSGDECRFKDIRSLAYTIDDGTKRYIGAAFITIQHEERVEATRPEFTYPTAWNEDIQARHVDGLKDVIARSLLPTLEKELDGFMASTPGREPVWRAMETTCRPTCDGCMTSMFCGTYMCSLCGREVCEDCLERIRAAVGAGRPQDYIGGVPPRILLKDHGADVKRVLSCFSREGHYPEHFRRTSRFTVAQLRDIIAEMRARVSGSLDDGEATTATLDQQPSEASTSMQIDTENLQVSASDQTSAPSLAGTSSGATSLAGSPSPPESEPSPTAIEPAIASSASDTTSDAAHALLSMAARISSPPPSHTLPTPTPTPTPPPPGGTALPATAVVPTAATNPTSIPTLVGDYGSELSGEDDASQLDNDREATPTPLMPVTPTLDDAPHPPPLPPPEPSMSVTPEPEAPIPPASPAPSALTALTEDGPSARASPAPAPAPAPAPSRSPTPTPTPAAIPDPGPVVAPAEVAPPAPPPIPSYDTPHFKETDADWTEDNFRKLWAQGKPVVVTDLLHKFTHAWSPEYFIENYGHQACKLVECQSEREEDRDVETFFRQMGTRRALNGDIWKLKDWPPTSEFSKDFPELYMDFENAVPMPSYTRRDGVFNIASHFPQNALKPDLGPKMYNAFATFETAGSKGSTRLHMDVADAVNIMLWSKRPPEDPSTEPPCAAWDIFRAEDADRLRELMREKFADAGDSDPIHSQKYYLDEDIRREFAERGVWSHRIYQRVGEAVFIPAGCAHQVCNLADCIKVAADFVSLENIQRCAQLTQEFRRLNFSYHWKEDVLQLRTMMWFAWESCSRRGLGAARGDEETARGDEETTRGEEEEEKEEEGSAGAGGEGEMEVDVVGD
ncbi:unnamed protein product [Peniophora sp. CBMAI 1063]|nr:unnamed protein product [Peniophora sp. CBMAI 1063]